MRDDNKGKYKIMASKSTTDGGGCRSSSSRSLSRLEEWNKSGKTN